MKKVFQRRFMFILIVLFGLVNVSAVMAQTPSPPKRKYPLTIYVSSISGSQGVGLFSLTVLGKTTSSLGRVGDNIKKWNFSAPDPYLILTVDLEDGVPTPIVIGASQAEYIYAWVSCADAFVTITGQNYSDTGGTAGSPMQRGAATIDLFNNYYTHLPISITVRGVSARASGK